MSYSSSNHSSDNKKYTKIRPSGGYHNLRSFQVATIIYDATVAFCDSFVNQRSRTVDQMVQAARSGRQNIAEGSRAASTSSKTELYLTNVARSSLDELLLDYEDYLRQHNLPQWAKNDPQAQAVRNIGKHNRTDPSDISAYAQWLNHPEPTLVANAIICLIHQANYLLDKQVAGLERDFIQSGGYSERLATARIKKRQTEDSSDQHIPTCPQCKGLMVMRSARKGKNAGKQFWGCSNYPKCKGTRPFEKTISPSDQSDPSDPSDPSDQSN
jgi:restriction system protein